MKHNCPMCGEQWDEDVCGSCGWHEGKQTRYSGPRRRARATGVKRQIEELADAESGVPPSICRELMDCAVSNGRISYHWLLRLYKRGVKDGREASEGVLAMTVDRLGGMVEGRPTERVNFLQRIDELREIERRAALPAAEEPR
jgi:hypothetical protein